MLELAILGILHEAPMHGYELRKQLAAKLGTLRAAISYGSLYPSLRRLQAAGWITEGAADETKARYAFVYGDFRRLHRMGLIASYYRAAEWEHKDIELAAHELLQYLDDARGLRSKVRARR